MNNPLRIPIPVPHLPRKNAPRKFAKLALLVGIASTVALISLAHFELLLMLLAFLCGMSWLAAAVLVRLSGIDETVESLRERALVQLDLSTVGTIAVLLAANRYFGWGWPSGVAILLLAVALLLAVMPGVIWLWLYIHKRFAARGTE